MAWSNYLDLRYRVYSLSTEDATVKISEMRDDLKKYREDIVFGNIEIHYLPVRPEDVKSAQAKGLLLTEHEDSFCISFRELPIKIPILQGSSLKGAVDYITHNFGDVFAVIKIVQEKLTEIQAV